MREYLIKGETLTALADEIRTLTEGTEKLGPDAMATSVNSANADVAEQLELINEIIDILRYKGGTLAELLSPATAEDLLEGKQLIDGDGNRVTGTMPNNGELALIMDGVDTTSVEIPAGYTSGGIVSLDDTLGSIVDEQAGLIDQINYAVADKSSYNIIYIGISEPTEDIGQDGDIYIVGEASI